MRIGRFLTITDVINYVIQYHVPALLITAPTQAIQDGVMTAISFNNEIYDYLNMWAAGNPTNIDTKEDAIWTLLTRIIWVADAVGNRIAQFSGVFFPTICHQITAASVIIQENSLHLTTHVNAGTPLQLVVYQNAGKALNVSYAQLLMIRHVKYPYPM